MEITRRMLKAKIHRAIVTEANLDYEGSLTIPPELLERADILEHEAVQVWDVDRGTRFETYAIMGERGTGSICVNGAAAHHAGPGDKIIIATFANVPESMVLEFRPIVVFGDDHNLAIRSGAEVPGPHRRGNDC
jgi:aspartate 1-decarboxylase